MDNTVMVSGLSLAGSFLRGTGGGNIDHGKQGKDECLDKAGIPHVSIESLKDKAYSLVGTPDDLEWEDKVVAVLEARDGTILDVVRKIKPLTL